VKSARAEAELSMKSMAAEVISSNPSFEVNELHCYLQQKGKILAGDDLVLLCTDFYTAEEIDNARITLKKYVPSTSIRLGKLKGALKDIAKRTVAVLLKACKVTVMTVMRL